MKNNKMKSKLMLFGAILMLVTPFTKVSGKISGKTGSLQIPTIGIPGSTMNKKPSKALSQIVNLHTWSSSTSPSNDTGTVTEIAYDANHTLSAAYAYKFDNSTYVRNSDVRTSYTGFIMVDPSKMDLVATNNSMYHGLLDSFQKNTLPGTQGSLNYYTPQKIKTQYLVNGSWIDSAELDITYNNNFAVDTLTSLAYINGTWKATSAAKVKYDNNGNQTDVYIVTKYSSNQALFSDFPGIEAQSIKLSYDKNKRVTGSTINFHYDGSGYTYNPSDLLPIYHESYYYDGNGKMIAASRKVTDSSSWGIFTFGASSNVNDSFSSLSYLNFKSNIVSLDAGAILHYGGSRIKGYTHWVYNANQNKFVQADRFSASMNKGNFYTELSEVYNSSKFVNAKQNQIYVNGNGSYKYNMITSYDANGDPSNKEAYKWTITTNTSGDITDWLETDSTLDLNGFTGYNFYHPVKYVYNSFATGVESENTNYSKRIFAYPNPVQNSINIKGIRSGDKLTILDATGKLIYHDEVATNTNYLLDVNHFVSGIYFIRVINGNEVQSIRFVKM
jgi:hypothetical protein